MLLIKLKQFMWYEFIRSIQIQPYKFFFSKNYLKGIFFPLLDGINNFFIVGIFFSCCDVEKVKNIIKMDYSIFFCYLVIIHVFFKDF